MNLFEFIKKGAYTRIGFLLFIYLVSYLLLIAAMTLIFGEAGLQNILHGGNMISSIYVVALYFMIFTSSFLFWNLTSELSVKRAFFSGDFLRPTLCGGAAAILLFFVFFIPALIPETFKNCTLTLLPNSGTLLVTHIFIYLVLGFTEEFIFRGIIFSTFSSKYSMLHATIATSLIFATAHMFSSFSPLFKLLFFVNLFLLSALFCYANSKFKNIYFSSVMHSILVYFLFFRNSMNLFTISDSNNIFLGLLNSPMSGIYAILILLIAILAVHYIPISRSSNEE